MLSDGQLELLNADTLYSLMFPDNRPALYAAVRWLTASRIDLSTHGFW